MSLTDDICLVPRWSAFPTLILVAAGLAAGCSGHRGPEYGADPLESKALAVPPDVSAEPVAPHHPFADLQGLATYRPGPTPPQSDGEWAVRISGTGMVTAVPPGWTLGGLRTALLLKGVAVSEEKETVLRTGWLGREGHSRLGIESPEGGEARYTLQVEATGDGGSRVQARGVVRAGGDEPSTLPAERVEGFLKALRPAFGRRPGGE
jgi:hypothetical protein